MPTLDAVDWTLFGLDGPLAPLMVKVGPPLGFVVLVGVLLAVSLFVVRLITKES